MLHDREELASLFGWNADDEKNGNDTGSPSASRGGFETMTQDQASELSGRFTALQESGYRLEWLVESLLQGNGVNFECITEIRDILYENNGYLGKIESYTRVLNSMKESLDSIKENTKNI